MRCHARGQTASVNLSFLFFSCADNATKRSSTTTLLGGSWPPLVCKGGLTSACPALPGGSWVWPSLVWRGAQLGPANLIMRMMGTVVLCVRAQLGQVQPYLEEAGWGLLSCGGDLAGFGTTLPGGSWMWPSFVCMGGSAGVGPSFFRALPTEATMPMSPAFSVAEVACTFNPIG